ncbi:hypothetical protein E5083_13150 [Streptomyces bauhiniae]|uniref:Uncharacterized protein n=1 Tax=Streptomyces bauhiniae TaxID=2340725 RepID=A0A4Z1D7B9_9ACTN|nr:hypothetical protein [Streptomyces bauhiniae]TGN78128.1 hypothetical protein E5083_13150 [Streptomyces bauhiniae]
MRCVHWRRVPLDLMREAQEELTGDHVDRAVQCQLSTHDGDHFGLLGDDGMRGTALWLRWHGMSEAELVVLPDCPELGGEGCCLFADHAEQHTWEGTQGEAPCAS